jgi:hypothetical protein
MVLMATFMATLAATLAGHPVAVSHAAGCRLRVERILLYLRSSPRDLGTRLPGYKATIVTVRPDGAERVVATYFDELLDRLEAALRQSRWVRSPTSDTPDTQVELDWQPAEAEAETEAEE